jgi:hypothetical protein
MYQKCTRIFFRQLPVLVMLAAAGLFSTDKASGQTCNTDLTNGITATSITTSGENAPNETKEKAFDNIRTTKWLTTATTGYLQADLGTARIVTNYSITSANDVPARDPKNFTLSGSNNGTGFTVLDTRTGETFNSRLLTKYYSFTNNTAYRYYRLTITSNNGDASTQLSEIELLPTNNCIVGNVYNSNAGVGYPAIPVLARTNAGTVASTTTDATGAFSFTTANAPATDYAILIQPPAGTYFSAGPVMNLNSSVMSADVYNYAQKQLWPTGAFLNVNGDGNSITGLPYMIDNGEGAKTPASLDWVLKPSPSNILLCPMVSTSLEGNGTFGNLSAADYISQHAWQPGFHSGPIPAAGEPHPGLLKAVSTATTNYVNGNTIYNGSGALWGEGRYNITSFMGTIQDVSNFYGRNADINFMNSSFSILNGHNGGWRKTYGHTTGDPYDLFVAANGQSTTTGSILQFTSNITSAGTKYLNFYGKNANAFIQKTATMVEIVFSVYSSANVLIASETLNLSPVTSVSQDDPTSPWEGRSFSFNPPAPGTYTFKVTVPTASVSGNDFYLDDFVLSECPIQYTLSGTVWNDANGNLVQNAGEAGTNISGSLHVNLINASGYIVSSVEVGDDGTYSMPIPQGVTGYKLVLTTNASLNTAFLPAIWVNTGENVDASNTAIQSGTLGVIELTTLSNNITGQNFGIKRAPQGSSLPVKLESFTGTSTDCNKVNLTWTVSDAVNFNHFEVESALDGAAFKAIATVFYDANRTTYNFYESSLEKRTYQYRLKMVDIDGRFNYSPVIFIKPDCSGQRRLLAYPNPVKENLTLDGLYSGQQVLMYNASGQMVQSKKVTGSQALIDMSTMNDGVFYIIVLDKNGVKTGESKVIKMK